MKSEIKGKNEEEKRMWYERVWVVEMYNFDIWNRREEQNSIVYLLHNGIRDHFWAVQLIVSCRHCDLQAGKNRIQKKEMARKLPVFDKNMSPNSLKSWKNVTFKAIWNKKGKKIEKKVIKSLTIIFKRCIIYRHRTKERRARNRNFGLWKLNRKRQLFEKTIFSE